MNSYRPRAIGTAAAIVALLLAGSGCSNTGATDGQQVTYSSATDSMVIEVSTGGGLAVPAVRVSDSLPRIWIAGDGRYLQQASDGSTNPALIALEERRIPEAALAGLLDGARAAGLLEDNPDYGSSRIADAMVTRIVIVTAGARHEVLVSALGYPDPGLPDAAVAARARLAQFLDVLRHPERIAGVSGPARYRPSAMAVFILGPASDPASSPPALWPLDDPRTAGALTVWPIRSARCLVVVGDELASVVSAAAEKDRFSPWRFGDNLWDIALRPLLPDEENCADVVG
jgi:hypothetical protein